MYVDKIEDLLSPQTVLSMSGLEFMQGILRGEIPAAPIARTLGYDLHDVSEGWVVFRGTPEFKAMNPIGSVHGGWYGTLLDSAMACSIQTTLAPGQAYTTLEYKVNLVRGIPIGTEIECVGETVHSGRSTAVATGEIRGVEDGKLYASGSTTCLVMTPQG